MQELKVDGWNFVGLSELYYLVILQYLHIGFCNGVNELPDFRGLINLVTSVIEDCKFKDVSNLSNLSALERLYMHYSKKLEILLNLQALAQVKELFIYNCHIMKGWDYTFEQGQGNFYKLDNNSIEFDLPYSQKLISLRSLNLWKCESFVDVMNIVAFTTRELGMRTFTNQCTTRSNELPFIEEP